MDQQKNQPPKPAPSAEEIARLEAEAVAAMRRGETPPQAPRPEAAAEGGQRNNAGRAPGFVPYVDDVPEPVPEPKAVPKAAPKADADDDNADDDGDYIPGKWEQRIDALSPEQWRLAQIIGGAVLGLAAVACLFVFGEELSTYGLIVAALLALLLPRYLERAWRRKLTTARYAMVAAMLAGLAVFAIVVGARTGFRMTK